VTTKRIVEYHIGRLQDKDPNVRLKSINELALLGDADALEALQSVYQNDSDARVKKAAQEAGRTIFLKLREQGVK
jgi:HEAT repeat protein